MIGSPLSLAATDQDTTVGLSAHERRVRGLSNWVRDFPVGQGGINEFEMAQLYGMLPHTDPAAASCLLDQMGDQLLIMGGHDQRDEVYREASERFDSLVEDAVSGDETGGRPTSTPEAGARYEYQLPERGAAVPFAAVQQAISDSGRQYRAGQLFVRNGLTGSYHIVERLIVDADGDVILWLT